MTSFTLRSRMIALVLAGSMLATAPAIAATKAKARPAATKTAPDQPPALTRDEAKAHAADIFDHLDFNKDGTFNEADMKARYEDRLGRAFDRLDANHDGSVTKAEYIAAHEQPRHPGAERPGAEGAAPHGPEGTPPPPPPGDRPGPDSHRGPDGRPGEGPGHHGMMSPIVFELLHEADPNHTGSVTKDAFIAAELKRFDEADANHDGKVTFEELRASHHGHGGHHRWGGPEGRGPEGRGPGGEGPRGWGPPPHGGGHGPDRGPDGGPDHGPDGHDAPPPPPLT